MVKEWSYLPIRLLHPKLLTGLRRFPRSPLENYGLTP